MDAPVLCCTDGSELSIEAVRSGLDLIDRSGPVVLVTVISDLDPTLVTGTGIAGGTMSADEHDRYEQEKIDDAAAVVQRAAAALGLDASDGVVLRGGPGQAICAHAAEVGARAIVIGSRGRGGLKRAVLGSVSDHVVRNAPCTVIVTNPSA